MLRLIPKEPNWISTSAILITLQNKGYRIDIRTLQRDLDTLSGSRLFPFTCNEMTKPQQWYWPIGSERFHLPIMEIEEALTFKLVEQFLEPLVPHSSKRN